MYLYEGGLSHCVECARILLTTVVHSCVYRLIKILRMRYFNAKPQTTSFKKVSTAQFKNRSVTYSGTGVDLHYMHPVCFVPLSSLIYKQRFSLRLVRKK